VLIEGDVALLDEANGLSGAVEVPDGVTEMQVTIESIGGVTLDSFNLPGQPEGTALSGMGSMPLSEVTRIGL